MATTSDVIPETTWPSEEMSLVERRAAFGNLLRAHRERSGITLVALAQATRISVSFLEAMEFGQVDKLPGQVFGRGFLRSICATIHVPASLFLEAFDLCWEGESLMAHPKLKTTNAERRAVPKEPRRSMLPATLRKRRWEYLVGAVIVAAAVVASIYLDRQSEQAVQMKLTPKASVQDALNKPTQDQAPVRIVTGELSRPVDRVSTAISDDAPEPSKQQVKPDPVATNQAPIVTATSAKFEQVLELKVTEPLRIKIATDNEGMETKELKPDTYRFRFEETADLLIYDAAALDVSFNGRSLGPLGSKGRVRRLTFEAKPDESQVY